MKISTTTGVLDTRLGYKNAVKLLKDAGFTNYDLSFYSSTPERDAFLNPNGYLKLASDFKSFTDSIGIYCNKTHAPFPSSVGDKEKDSEIFENIVRSMEFSSVLGADVIVIHPMQHLNYAEHQRELFDMNVAFYKKLVPYAEKFGIKIATENMWQFNLPTQIPTDSVCSRSWEFCELIDTVDSKWLVGCLDIGHTSLMASDIPDFIRKMGDRLLSLHIHDTDLKYDLHTLPFTQKIDFEAVCKALGSINYKGDVTFEAGCFFAGFPDELLPSAAKLMYDTGVYLASKIDESRP